MQKTSTLKIRIDPDRPDKEVIAYAAAIIRNGGIVAFPTETVYGLAANLLDKGAVERLNRVKNRPLDKHFTVHVADLKQVKKLGCRVNGPTNRIIKKFWPGPLTIILTSKAGSKIGFRMPANAVALKLIAASGVPVIAPSANISGKKPPTQAADVLKDLDGKIDLVLDAGRTKVGIESTVLDLTGKVPIVLRVGAVSEKTLLKVINSK